MIAFGAGGAVHIARGMTDMRRAMKTLAPQVRHGLGCGPHAGEIFRFRGRCGDLVQFLCHDGRGQDLVVDVMCRGFRNQTRLHVDVRFCVETMSENGDVLTQDVLSHDIGQIPMPTDMTKVPRQRMKSLPVYALASVKTSPILMRNSMDVSPSMFP